MIDSKSRRKFRARRGLMDIALILTTSGALSYVAYNYEQRKIEDLVINPSKRIEESTLNPQNAYYQQIKNMVDDIKEKQGILRRGGEIAEVGETWKAVSDDIKELIFNCNTNPEYESLNELIGGLPLDAFLEHGQYNQFFIRGFGECEITYKKASKDSFIITYRTREVGFEWWGPKKRIDLRKGDYTIDTLFHSNFK